MSKSTNNVVKPAIVLSLLCVLMLSGCQSVGQTVTSDTSPAEIISSTTTDGKAQTTVGNFTEQSAPSEELSLINPVSIEFPAHQYARTEYNSAVLDIQPFTLSLDLPEGWSVQIPEESEYSEGMISSENSAVYLCNADDVKVGAVDYDTFELNFEGADTAAEIPYRAVYSDLMLSNHSTWDCDYTVVKDEGAVNAATCKIMTSAMISESGEEEKTPAALAYNAELLVYVKLSFDDGSITDTQLESIAKSIDIR